MQETMVSIHGSEDPLGVGNGIPLQYSCLDISMDSGDGRATVHGVAESQTQLNTHTQFRFKTACLYIRASSIFKSPKLHSPYVH